jgi:predicted SAM-dependent methyltransferase
MYKNTLNINIGCGHKAATDWKNFDSSPTLLLEKIPILSKLFKINENTFPKNVLFGDITKKILCEPNAAENIYCSHTLEHMSREEMIIALNNIFIMLKPGGVFRVVVPSLESRIKKYHENNDADLFMDSLHMGEKFKNNFIDKIRSIFGNSKHKWMYDDVTLHKHLKNAGFRNIRKCFFLDSKKECFSNVEQYSRFLEPGLLEATAYQATK